MIFIFCITIFLLLITGFRKKTSGDLLPHDTTLSINAVFVALVFFSHFFAYISPNYYDTIYGNLPFSRSQLIVTTFLFFSGYGLMESLKKKEYDYIRTFIPRRFLKVFWDFCIAILLFLLVNTIIKSYYSPTDYLLALTGWTSVGNSNWYLFATFSFYLFFFLVFLIFKGKPRLLPIIIISALCVGYVVLTFFYKSAVFYNTFLCLPAGLFVSYYKEKILKLCANPVTYIIALAVSVTAFFVSFHFASVHFAVFEIASVSFVFMVTLLCQKVDFHNRLLVFIGKYTFWIYILQRLPMRFFQYVGVDSINTYLYMALCLITTIMLALPIKRLSDKLYSVIFKPKKSAK